MGTKTTDVPVSSLAGILALKIIRHYKTEQVMLLILLPSSVSMHIPMLPSCMPHLQGLKIATGNQCKKPKPQNNPPHSLITRPTVNTPRTFCRPVLTLLIFRVTCRHAIGLFHPRTKQHFVFLALCLLLVCMPCLLRTIFTTILGTRPHIAA